MKQATLWLIIVAGVLLLAYVLYRSRGASTDLDVEPHAAEEIKKAKRQ